MVRINRMDLVPIIMTKGARNKNLFGALQKHKKVEEIFFEASEKVFKIMQRENLIQSPEQRAVWIQQGFFGTNKSFIRQIGDSFPNETLKERYRKNLEKGFAMLNDDDYSVCSNEIRNPDEGIYGGIIKLNFQLISSGKVSDFNCTLGAIGLREWESLGLVIGIFHYLGIAGLKDRQIQEILFRADQAAIKEPPYKPRLKTIPEFVKDLLRIIG